ncbi:MAG TPA: hypothetical protein VEG39_10735, partial [Clostridia bacterium]|nr:hypothetical protein [Clostridia bacterium]
IEQTGWTDIAKATKNEAVNTAYDDERKDIHIDYILTNIKGSYDYKVKFNGTDEVCVSDHKGVYACIE